MRKYIPELPDYGSTITIRHLLNHARILLQNRTGGACRWKMASLVDEEGSLGTDVIVLPELARGLDDASEEPLNASFATAPFLTVPRESIAAIPYKFCFLRGNPCTLRWPGIPNVDPGLAYGG